MMKSRPCFSGWKIRHHKMRTAASHLCCSLPCHHLLFSTSHISLIILFMLKLSSFYSTVKTSQETRLLRHHKRSLCKATSTVHLSQPASASGDFAQYSNKLSGPPRPQTAAEQNHVEVRAPVHSLSCPRVTKFFQLFQLSHWHSKTF